MNDIFYIERCLELAEKGIENVSPNPMVGCVIVHNDKIIGEGFHEKYGQAHAEVNAINSVENKELLKESTIYVSLEPCSFYGKTPPCVDLILKYKIPKVVICNLDTNPKVNGQGIFKLQSAGVEVISGILEDKGKFLNRRFFTSYEKNRPYIILKWAHTIDGFMDVERRGIPVNYWITNDAVNTEVHRWRAQEDAIMVGANTIINDNPQLNVRHVQGKNPVRIVLNYDSKLPVNSNIFDSSQKTIIYTKNKQEDILQTENLIFVELDPKEEIIKQILKDLHKRRINSIIVEGGKMVLKSFLDENLWDEARVITGNKSFGKGMKAPIIKINPHKTENIEGDIISFFYN